jgi:formimidoylglutamate deiminase
MPSPPRAYLPDLLFAGGEVHQGAALSVADGAVVAVGAPAPGFERVRLAGRALLPGLVSAHSHSFQRAIRGRTEVRHPGRSDFWSWREAMYRAANRLDPEDVRAVARMVFHEMARAGITAVGEFHYLSRDPSGRRYDDPELLAKEVIGAAREVGLRITLLRSAYARGGPGLAAGPEQARFLDGSPDEVVESVLRLEEFTHGDVLATLGIAPHSVRACPAGWIGTLAAEALRRGWPLHVHVSEQAAEVAQCRAEHGLTPVELLEKLGALGPATTAVHAIHVTPGDIDTLGRTATTVCACPTTERDLGDGVVPADDLLQAGAALALGTDSNVQIDLLEDARALEGNLRLLRRERGLLAPAGGDGLADGRVDGRVDGLAARLYGFASRGGMRSLALPGGSLDPGDPADFVAVDLEDPSIAGASAADLLPAVVFSAARTAVRDVVAGGEAVVTDGEPSPGRPGASQIARDFARTMKKLWGG